MRTKLVIRVMDSYDRMLGWEQTEVTAKGDGCLWTVEQVEIKLTEEGTPHSLSLHLADINVETRVPVDAAFAKHHLAGEKVFVPRDVVVLTLGKPPVGLPQVTVGSKPVVISVPPGTLSAVGR